MSYVALATSAFTAGVAPSPLPVLGHGGQLLREPLGFLQSLRTHGDLVQIRLGPQRAYVVCHPELALQVLKDDRTFDKGGPLFDRLRDILGNGLGTCPHRDHRRQRRLIQPAFHRARLERYGASMEEELARLLGGWHSGDVLDVFPVMYSFTLRSVLRTLFSAHIDGTTAAGIQRSFETVLGGVMQRMFVPEPLLRLPTPGNRRYQQCRRHLFDSVDRIIADYRAEQGPAGDDSGDLLSALLATGADGAAGPDDREIRDQVISMMMAGSESLGATLAWALHQLTRDPVSERRLHEEVDAVLGGRPARWPDLPHLPFTGRLLTETMRLHPPGWLFTRITRKEVELAGLRLPPGSTVVITPVGMHRDPDLYERPEVFDPDRWLPERAAALPRGAFLAWGGGPRKCIGDTFAMAEGTLALATIASRWRLRPAPGNDPRPARLTTVLHPRRLRLTLTARPVPATAP
ncbi:cytochrome P450 [Streptomyces sp. SCA3-4]|uniref:cytochrome P450 n=1 Tax=Streptomyces sichuanensis TaxID=2871810 RepID=UPI001CE332D4|nr:cytochrome P450 [Streptomyces sichuanensis]MCA6095258.1 cytochrome P450 [Streptomyces sichuanensis]